MICWGLTLLALIIGIAVGGFVLFFIVAGEGWLRQKLREQGMPEDQIDKALDK